MSKVVDERVVEMVFDNKQFESNVKTSMSTLDKLKQKLNFKDTSKGFDNLNRSAKKVDMSALSKGVDTAKLKFSALQVAGVTALANITNSAVNAGKNIVKALTIDPVRTGFNEYELKMDSIRTIMASTGESIGTVNKYLNELNEYSDQTIYSFADMTQNIGKFTNAGVKLEDAVMAIKGISNEAAVSGANANEASRAMYNFAQALSAGYVKLIDWKSIELANMATVEFKQQLIDAAVAAGTLTKASDGMYMTLEGNTLSATKDFNETLQDQWMTTEVLVNTLKDYADNTTEIGKKAFAAAQDVTKFTQMMDVLKETAQSGWARTWELLFGDIEQAKAIFTPLTDFFSGVINKISDFRNNLLEGALSSPFGKLAEKISSITNVTKTATEKMQNYGEIVNKVINGDFGNGEARFRKLTEAGYDWATVQNKVNEKLGSGKRYATDFKEAQEELTQKTEELTDAQLKEIGLTEEEIKAYRDLEKQSKETGVSIQDLIKNMNQMDGRTMIVESFKNVGKSLVAIINSIKEAWVNVFPPMTSQQLYNIISALYEFSQKLVIADETADKLRRTFEGLFAALDIVLTVVGGPIKIAFKVLGMILDAADLSILDLTASIGDAIVGFKDWLDSTLNFTKVFEKISPYIKITIDMIKSFIDSIKNVVDAVKNAWSSVFGEADGDTMHEAADGVRDFTESMAISESAATNFQKVCDGISAVMSKLSFKLSASLPNAFKLLKSVLELFGTNIGEVTGVIADHITKLRSWIDEHLLLGNSIGEVSKVLKALVDGVVEVVKAFSQLEFVKNIISGIGDAISSIFGDLSDGLSSFNIDTVVQKISSIFSNLTSWIKGIDNADNIGLYIIQGLVKGIMSGISTVANAVMTLGRTIISAICSVLGIHSPSTKFIEIGKNIIDGLINGLKSGLSKVASFFKDLGQKMIGFIKNIDFGTVFSVALSAAMITGLIVAGKTISKFVSVLDKFAAPFEGLGKMFSGIGKAFSSLGDKIKAEVWKEKSKAILNLAIAIGILAASAYLLAKVDVGQLAKAVVALAALAGIIALLSFAASKIDMGGNGGFGKLSLFMLGISTSLIMLSFAMKNLQFLNKDNVVYVLGGLAAMIAGLSLILLALGTLSKGSIAGNIDKAGTTILKISAAMLLMTLVIKQISELDPGELGRGLVCILAFSAIITGLIAATRLAGKGIDKAGGTILKISAAILMMVFVVKLLSKLDGGEIAKGIATIIAFGGIITGLIAATRLAGGSVAAKLGSTILGISAAMMLMAITVKMVAGLDKGEIAKGIVCISAFGGIVTGLIAATRLAGGGNLKGVASTLLMMSISIGILAGVSVILGLVNFKNLMKGVTAVSILGLIVSAMVRATKDAKDCKGSLIAMTVAIGIMAAAVIALSFIDPSKLAGATAAMSILMGMFALMTKSTQYANASKGTLGALIALTAVAGAMTGIIYILSKMDTDAALSGSASLSLLLLSLSASLRLISGISKSGKDMAVGILALLGMCVPLLALVGILYAMQGIETSTTNVIALVSLATALTLLLIPLSLVGTIIGSSGGTAALGIVALLGMCVPLLALVGILYAMQGIETSTTNVTALIALATALTLLLIPLSVVGIVMAASMGTAALGIVALLGMCVPLLALVGILYAMQGIENASTNAELLTTFMEKMTDMLVKVSLVAPLAIMADVAIAGFMGILVALGGLATAVGALTTKFPQLEEFVDTGIPILEKLANGLGSIIGNFVNGFMTAALQGLPEIGTLLSRFIMNAMPFIVGVKMVDESVLKGIGILTGAILALTAADLITGIVSFVQGGSSFSQLGTELSKFITNAMPFIFGASLIDDSVMTGIKNLAQAILILTAADLISGITSFIFGNNSLADFGKQIGQLGTDLNDFATNLGTFNDDQVKTITCACEAIKILAEAASELPNEGGLAGAIFGDNGLGDFASQFAGTGESLKTLASNLKGFGTDQVESIRNGAEAIKALSEVASELPNEGGLSGDIFGDNGLGDFVSQFADTGESLKTLASKLEGFGTDQVESIRNGAEAIKALSEVASELPNDGGLAGAIFGDNGLGDFVKQINTMGDGLSDFAEKTSGIKDKVTGAIDALKTLNDLSTLDFSNLKTNMSDIGDVVKNAVKSLSSLKDLKVDTSALDSFKQSLTDLGSKSIDGLITGFQNGTERAKAAISNFISSIASSTSGGESFKQKFNSIGTSAVNGFVTGFQNGAGKAKDAVSSFMNSLSASVASGESFKQKLTSMGTNGINGFVTGFTAGSARARAAVTSFINAIVSAVTSGASRFKQAMTKLANDGVNAFVNAIKSGTAKAKAAVQSLINAVSSVSAGNLKTNMHNIGLGVGEGLASGIKASTPTAVAAVSAMNAAVEAEARKGLKINSPSKVFIPIGSSVVEGLAKGITDNLDYAKNSTQVMGQTLLDSTKSFLKINSPSLVFKEEVGRYIVEGIAEGIEEDNSAEEAAEKKAQKIIDTFKKAIDRNSTKIDIDKLKYDLWTKTEGEDARPYVADAKQIDFLTSKINKLKDSELLAKSKYYQLKDEFGEDSDKTDEAFKDWLQIQNDIEDAMNERDEVRHTQSLRAVESIDDEMYALDKEQELREKQKDVWDKTTGKEISKDMKEYLDIGYYQDNIDNFLEQRELAIIKYNKLRSLGEDTHDALLEILDWEGKIAEAQSKITETREKADEEERKALEDRLDLYADNSDLEYQIWEKTLGKNASDDEKYARKLMSLNDQLNSDASFIELAKSDWDKAINEFGANSDEANKARKTYLEKVLNWVNTQEEITSISEEVAERQKKLQDRNSLALVDSKKYIDEYRKYYLENGMTLAELEKDAKLVSGYDPKNSASTMFRETYKALNQIQGTTAYANISYSFEKLGTTCAEAITKGVSKNVPKVVENVTTTVQSCSTAINEEKTSWQESGKCLVDSFVEGIQYSKGEAIEAAVDLATAAMEALKRVVNSDIDAQPVIRPVLDLSNVEANIAGLNAMVSSSKAMQISASMGATRSNGVQNGVNNSSGGNTYQFTQNNYSPKALSRTEIYRQTKNQFTAMKGALV